MEQAREKFAEAKAANNETARLEHSKEYVIRAAEAIVNHLEKLKSRIEESDNIDEERAAELITKIDAQISEVQELKQQAEAATTLEEIKGIAKALNEKWKSLKHFANVYSDRVVAARVKGLVNQGRVLEARLDKILERLEASNITVDVEAEVNEFSAKIAEARDKQAQAQEKLRQAFDLAESRPASNEEIKALTDAAKELLDAARESMREAHRMLTEIVSKIKEAAPGTELDTDEEVELAEEASEVQLGGDVALSDEAQATLDTLVASLADAVGKFKLKLEVEKDGGVIKPAKSELEVEGGSLTPEQEALWQSLKAQSEALVEASPEANAKLKLEIEHELELEDEDDDEAENDDEDKDEEDENDGEDE